MRINLYIGINHKSVLRYDSESCRHKKTESRLLNGVFASDPVLYITSNKIIELTVINVRDRSYKHNYLDSFFWMDSSYVIIGILTMDVNSPLSLHSLHNKKTLSVLIQYQYVLTIGGLLIWDHITWDYSETVYCMFSLTVIFL